jgi:hypothetical protein
MTRQASPPWFHSTPALHISGRQRSLWGCCGSIRKSSPGVPMSLNRVANVLDTDTALFQEFCDRLSMYGDRTLLLFADGQAVEVPVSKGTLPFARRLGAPRPMQLAPKVGHHRLKPNPKPPDQVG